jgi:hypothetical protein
LLCLAAALLALNLTTVFGQPAPQLPKPMPAPQLPPPGSENFHQRLQEVINRANPPANQPPPLTKFNLDFPGGTPAELVKAIEKAMGKPLNGIIPTEDADLQMPPLKMNDVNTAQLFAALEVASQKSAAFISGNQHFGYGNTQSYSTYQTSYGFKTADYPVTDTSIWYFHAEKPGLLPVIAPEKVCRFYSLATY